MCDCPCSGYGVIKDNPDIKLRKTEENVSELNKIQYSILSTCSKYVKKGGSLYYSTCSVFRSENEDICLEFLKNNPEFEAVEIESKLVSEKMKVGISFFPDKSFGAGFYVCKFIRK